VCCRSPEFCQPRVNSCGARRIDDRNAAQTLKVSANRASATKNAGFAEHLASIAKNMVPFGRRRLPKGLPASAAQGDPHSGFPIQFSTNRKFLAACHASEVCQKHPLKTEGAGKTGCALHPRSRVQMHIAKTHTSIQVQRKHSGLPCAVVLTVTSRSPR
jgi:hypothetical protein